MSEAVSFTDRVERAFQDVLAGPPHVSQSTVPHAYASEATRCARQIAYRIAEVGEAEETDLGSEIAFHLGNHLHEKLQTALAAIIPSFAGEVRWDEGDLTGRADGTFTTPSGLAILEIKTMNPKAFERADKAGEPKEDHLGQAMLSARHLGAKWVYIPYINKARGWGLKTMMHSFLPYDPVATETEAQRLKSIVRDVKHGVLPDRIYKGKAQTPETITEKYPRWPCSYCAFQARCVQDGPGVGRIDTPVATERGSW